MTRFRTFLTVLLLAGACLSAAIYGAGSSYHGFITPRTSKGEFSRIDSDGWIESRSLMSFHSLAFRGNQLTLKFKDWHPEGAAPAALRVFVCDQLASEFTVTPGERYTVYLTGSCQPRKITFEVLNPHKTEIDQRELGAQIESIAVKSKLGVPLLRLSLLVKIGGLLLVLSLVCFAVFQKLSLSFLGLLVPLGGFFSLQYARFLDLQRPFSLWLFIGGIFSGILIALILTPRELQMTGSLLHPERVKERSGFLFMAAALALIGAGIALRFYGIAFGLPANYHPDEVRKFMVIEGMVRAGDLNPRYFLHPSLLLYSTYFFNNLFHWLNIFQGEWESTLILAGRMVSAVAGCLSIGLVFLIAKGLYSNRAGLIGAALLAVFPLHVTCSRYLKEDSLLVFATLLCTAVMIRAVKKDSVKLYMLAGLLAGCSASVKYSGVLSIVILLLAPWLKSKSLLPDLKYCIWLIPVFICLLVGFAAGTPYSVLAFDKFLYGFNYEKAHMIKGHTLTIDAWSQYWMYHFSRSMLAGLTVITAVLAVAGTGLLLWRRKAEDLFVLILVLLFYCAAEYVKAKPAPQPERYILPCLPFLAIALGEFIRILMNSRFIVSSRIVLALALLLPFIRSVNLASEIKIDTRARMENWMLDNIPRGSRVYIDWKPYSPRFWNNEFEVQYIPRDKTIPSLDLSKLQSEENHYLLLSSLYYGRYFTQPQSDLIARERIRGIFRRAPIVKHVQPRHGTYGFHNPSITLFSLNQAKMEELTGKVKLKQAGKLEFTPNEVLIKGHQGGFVSKRVMLLG